MKWNWANEKEETRNIPFWESYIMSFVQPFLFDKLLNNKKWSDSQNHFVYCSVTIKIYVLFYVIHNACTSNVEGPKFKKNYTNKRESVLNI